MAGGKLTRQKMIDVSGFIAMLAMNVSKEVIWVLINE
jgi:hypothetical protein